MKTVKGQIREFIAENLLLGAEREFNDQASFLDMGIIDSTGVIELIAFVEERFGIQVHDAEIVPDNLDGVAVLEAFILRKLAGRRNSMTA